MATKGSPGLLQLINDQLREFNVLADRETAILLNLKSKIVEQLRGRQIAEDFSDSVATIVEDHARLRKNLVDACNTLSDKVKEEGSKELGTNAENQKRITEMIEHLYHLFIKAFSLISGSEALETTYFEDFKTYLETRDQDWMKKLDRVIRGHIESDKRKVLRFSSAVTKEDSYEEILGLLLNNINQVMVLLGDVDCPDRASFLDECEKEQLKIQHLLKGVNLTTFDASS